MERLEEFKSVRRWLTKLSKKSDSSNTRRAYLTALRQFCKYVGRTPDQLVEKKRKDS